jgi:hypothetical protein
MLSSQVVLARPSAKVGWYQSRTLETEEGRMMEIGLLEECITGHKESPLAEICVCGSALW